MTVWKLNAAMAGFATIGLAVPVLAGVPSLPQVRPSTETGKPVFGSAATPGVNAFDLKKAGYAEAEYYFTGDAAVRDDKGNILVASAPYTTRILVRSPLKGRPFSGTVIVTPFNWDRESAREWGLVADSVVRRGDMFVGVSIVKYEIPGFPLKHGIKMLQGYDPVRYGPLAVYEDHDPKRQDMAQSQDILAQLGLLLKSGGVDGRKAQKVIAFSIGVSARVVEAYIAQGRHNDMRMADGKPLYDGYLLSANPLLPVPDAAQRGDAVFVLVQNERELHRDTSSKILIPDDSDAPKFRLYDFVGAPHLAMIKTDRKTGVLAHGNDVPEVPVAPPPGGASAAMCKLDNIEPVGAVFSSLLAGTVGWSNGGPALPRAPRVELADTGVGEKVDPQTGNALGGMRPPWISVPAASYVPGGTVGCGVFEPMLRYDAAKLRGLYGTYANYARKFAAAKQAFIKAGFLTSDNADEVKPTASPQDFLKP